VRILGIDPGSRVCGYAVLEADGPRYRYVECGVLTAPAGRPFEQRLAEIGRQLTDLIAELAPAVVAVEDVFSRINIRSALALAQARGAVIAVAGLAGLPVHSYAAPLVKRAVTGRGRASKEQVGRMVAALVGLSSPPEEDAADALAVAITHAHRHRQEAAA
jgi:crossover junction endodeoxyribonuclease RuvC